MNKWHYMTFSESFVIDMREGKPGGYNSFDFSSSDSKTLDWLAKSIEASSFKLGFVGTFPSGSKYTVSVTEIEAQDSIKMRWWFLKQLGLRGWEVFSIVEPYPEVEDEDDTSKALSFLETKISFDQRQTIHLRRMETAKKKEEKSG